MSKLSNCCPICRSPVDYRLHSHLEEYRRQNGLVNVFRRYITPWGDNESGVRVSWVDQAVRFTESNAWELVSNINNLHFYDDSTLVTKTTNLKGEVSDIYIEQGDWIIRIPGSNRYYKKLDNDTFCSNYTIIID